MRTTRLALTLLIATLPFTVLAKDTAAKLVRGGYTPPPCIDGMSKTASININFNGQEKTLAEARAAFDAQKKEMEAEAAKLGGDQLQLNNYNYNVSMSQNYNGGMPSPNFNFSGNLSYQTNSEELAQKISNRLAEMKRQFSMNINANRCQN